MRDLSECAESLRKIKLTDPADLIEELIKEGYIHLGNLRSSRSCNPTLVNSLAHRIDRAEAILEHRKQLK